MPMQSPLLSGLSGNPTAATAAAPAQSGRVLRSAADIDSLPDPHPEALKALDKNPLIRAVADFEVPGLRATADDMAHPEVQQITANLKGLKKYGLSIFGASDGSTAVFNPKVLSANQIVDADRQGVLGKMLPTVAEFLGGAKGGAAQPAPAGDPGAVANAPAAPAAAPTQAAPIAAPAAPVAAPNPGPAPAQQAQAASLAPIAAARKQAIQQPNASPTAQHVPGAGFLNDLARSTV